MQNVWLKSPGLVCNRNTHTRTKKCKSFDRTLKIMEDSDLLTEEPKLFHCWFRTCFRMFVGQFEPVWHMLVSNLRRQSSSNLTIGSTGYALPHAVFLILVLITCILFIKQRLIHTEGHRKWQVCPTQPSELFVHSAEVQKNHPWS